MTRCYFCGQVYPTRTHFCDECNSHLLDDTQATNSLGTNELSRATKEVPQVETLGRDTKRLSIRLLIGGGNRVIHLPLERQILLGRVAPNNEIFPEVDLTDDEGDEKKISRRHARIIARNRKVIMEDLGSRNGTFVNGLRLRPGVPLELHYGDKIQLANLPIRVEISKRVLGTITEERKLFIQRMVQQFLAPQETNEAVPFDLQDYNLALKELAAIPEQEYVFLEDMSGRRQGLLKRGGSPISIGPGRCQVYQRGYQFFVEAPEGKQVVTLNGLPLEAGQSVRLRHRDVIQGDSQRLLFFDHLTAVTKRYLNTTFEKIVAAYALKSNFEANRPVALLLLVRLFDRALADLDHDSLDEITLVIRDLTALQPIETVNILAQATGLGHDYVHPRLYRTFAEVLGQNEAVLLPSLALLEHYAQQFSPQLYYWIAREVADGPVKSILDARRSMLLQNSYTTETELADLFNTLRSLAKDSRPEERLPLYQTLFELLRVRTISQLSLFGLPDSLKPKLLQRINLDETLNYFVEIADLTQKSRVVVDTEDKLTYFADALLKIERIKNDMAVKEDQPEERFFHKVLGSWEGIISNASHRLRGRAVLHVELLTKQAFVGEQITLALKMRNTGQAYAENISITLQPDPAYDILEDPIQKFPLLRAKRHIQIEFTVRPKREDRIRVEAMIKWDDPEHNQKQELFADTVNFLKAKKEFTRIRNPYVAGNPVSSPKMFFGRQDVFDFIIENLMGGEQKNTLVLHGQRRTGKSSILLQLRDRVLPSDLVPVYINLESFPDVKTLGTFLARLASEIQQAVIRQSKAASRHGQPGPIIDLSTLWKQYLPRLQTSLRYIFDPGGTSLISENLSYQQLNSFFTDQPTLAFDQFMDAIETRCPRQKFVVMFDEFELIEQKINNGLDAGLLSYLRNLMQHRDTLVFIFTGTHRLQEMTFDYWNILFGIALNREISFLEQADTRRLITEPVRDHLEYDDLTVEKIIRVTRCQPYLVQLICWQLVNYLNEHERNYATINDLNKILDQTLVTAEAYFSNIWRRSTPLQQALLALVTTLVYPGKETVAYEEIEQGARDRQIPITPRELMTALHRLCQRDILREHATGELHYHFQVDLMRMWIEQNKPLARVLIEQEMRTQSLPN